MTAVSVAERSSPPDGLDSLVFDGDEIELPGGRLLRLRVTPDEYMRLDDLEWYGSFAWVDHQRRNAYGHRVRPDGFDGNAEILAVRAGGIWWQPPVGVARTDWEGFAAVRRDVVDVLEFGLSILTLELCDSSGVVLAGASEGSVGPNDEGVALELWHELADAGWFDQLLLW